MWQHCAVTSSRRDMADHARSKLSGQSARVLIAILVGIVIFVIVATMRQEQQTSLEGLSESELVRLLDDIDTRIAELSTEHESLTSELEELQSGADSRAAAAEAAAQQETARKILAGVVPVAGPGVSVKIYDSDSQLSAQYLVTIVQELRNSAAESIEVNSVRIVTRTSIVQDGDVISIDGRRIAPPYTINAIGDADMMRVALEMPGGILASIRSRGPTTDLVQKDRLEITSVAELPEFDHAQPIN